MNRIILNIVDKKTEFSRRISHRDEHPLQSCDFITIGEDIMFDRDTDFFTFGFDVDTGSRQLAIVTGDFIPMPPAELIGNIKKSLEGRYEVVADEEAQLWLREKSP